MNNNKNFSISIDLLPDEAWALAEFVKRVGWNEIRANSENDKEAYMIQDTI